jgi:hypothetical protein
MCRRFAILAVAALVLAATPVHPQSGDRLVYADFDRVEDGRPDHRQRRLREVSGAWLVRRPQTVDCRRPVGDRCETLAPDAGRERAEI